MLKIITNDGLKTEIQLAEEVRRCWPDKKVVHIRNTQDYAPEHLRAYYDRFLEALGTPIGLAEDARIADRMKQRTGERWMDIRYDPAIKNAYRHSSAAQPLHTDGSYIPRLPDAAITYCQSSAKNGGETIFVDSTDLIEILERESPELLNALRTTPVIHERSGDQRVATIVDEDHKGLKLHWNYYCVSKHSSAEALQIRDRFHDFLQTSAGLRAALVSITLKPGDCVIWKDDRTLHGRNAFHPSSTSERFLHKSAVEIAP